MIGARGTLPAPPAGEVKVMTGGVFFFCAEHAGTATAARSSKSARRANRMEASIKGAKTTPAGGTFPYGRLLQSSRLTEEIPGVVPHQFFDVLLVGSARAQLLDHVGHHER